jgi:sodium-coupled neutral amino acid transporter 11
MDTTVLEDTVLIPTTLEDDETKPKVRGTASKIGILFNLTNTTVGTGILALPYAMRSAGLVMGIIMTLVAACTALGTLHMLLYVGSKRKRYSYKDIANNIFGRQIAGVLVEIAIIMFTVGVMAVFIGIISDYTSSIILAIASHDEPTAATLFFADKRVCGAIMLVFIIFPLCCLRRIQLLSYTSIMSIFGILFVVVVVVIRLVEQGLPTSTPKKPNKIILLNTGDPMSVFMAFPVVFFSFASHINYLSMYEEMKNRSRKSMARITNLSTALTAVLYLTMSICGYLLFIDDTEGNVLNGFDKREKLIIGAKVAITLVVVTSFPLVHFSARQSIDSLLFDRPFSWIRFILEAVVICIPVYGISVLIPDLADLVGFTGATIGTLIQFVIPALFFLFARKEKRWKIVAIICMLFSACIGVIGTVSVIMDFVRKKM